MEFIEGLMYLTEYKDWLTSRTQKRLQDLSVKMVPTDIN